MVNLNAIGFSNAFHVSDKLVIMKWQFLSITILIFLYHGPEINCEAADVCAMDQCDDSLDWEIEDFSAQFRSWLAQERSKNKVVFCKDEAEKRPLSETPTRLYKYERCAFIDYWVSYQYQGKRDQEKNMFKGKGTLTFVPHDLSSGYQRQSHTKQIGVNDDEFYIIDNAFMSLQSIVGQFKSGLPHGEIQIKHHNFAELKVSRNESDIIDIHPRNTSFMNTMFNESTV